MSFKEKERLTKEQVTNNSFKDKAKDAAGATGRGVGHVASAASTGAKAVGRGVGHAASAVKDASKPVAGAVGIGVKNLGTAIKGMTSLHNSDFRHKATVGRSRAIDKD